MFLFRIMLGLAVIVASGLSQTIATPPAGRILFVDDDGVQCRGALKSIQGAVTQAAPVTAILVCPDIYYEPVGLSGSAKTAIQLIELGLHREVVLIGDHTEACGERPPQHRREQPRVEN